METSQPPEALTSGEDRFASAFEYASIGMALVGTDGRWLKVNRSLCKLVGYTVEELLSKTFQDITHPADLDSDLVKLHQLIAGETVTYEMEKRYFHKRGHVVWVFLSVSLLRDAQGRPLYFISQIQDITGRKVAEAELEATHRRLVDISRQAGMAEVATSVLHNVGNVLNSVNVASACLADNLRLSKSANLSKVVALLRAHEADMGEYLTTDPKGKQIPGYLANLATHLAGEQSAALGELAQLQKNIEHIMGIISLQQGTATFAGYTETLSAAGLVEDALKMNATSIDRQDIQVIREFDKAPPLTTEKHKVLQILVNLIRNAGQACDESGSVEKRITLRVSMPAPGRVSISVGDNGVGIPPENFTRIFSLGFTTKKGGHGFGLHSAALAAKEMGGSLSVHSDGPGKGATLTLELPLQPGA